MRVCAVLVLWHHQFPITVLKTFLYLLLHRPAEMIKPFGYSFALVVFLLEKSHYP